VDASCATSNVQQHEHSELVQQSARAAKPSASSTTETPAPRQQAQRIAAAASCNMEPSLTAVGQQLLDAIADGDDHTATRLIKADAGVVNVADKVSLCSAAH
jgi:hypothetical protein